MLKYELCYFISSIYGEPLLAVVNYNNLDFTSVVRIYYAPAYIYVMMKGEAAARYYSTIETNGDSNGESKTYGFTGIRRD